MSKQGKIEVIDGIANLTSLNNLKPAKYKLYLKFSNDDEEVNDVEQKVILNIEKRSVNLEVLNNIIDTTKDNIFTYKANTVGYNENTVDGNIKICIQNKSNDTELEIYNKDITDFTENGEVIHSIYKNDIDFDKIVNDLELDNPYNDYDIIIYYTPTDTEYWKQTQLESTLSYKTKAIVLLDQAYTISSDNTKISCSVINDKGIAIKGLTGYFSYKSSSDDDYIVSELISSNNDGLFEYEFDITKLAKTDYELLFTLHANSNTNNVSITNTSTLTVN